MLPGQRSEVGRITKSVPPVTQSHGQAPAGASVWPCLTTHGGAVRLEISASPGARRTGVNGLHDGALRVRLAAPPVDGKANEQLIAWLADELGLARRSIRLLRGETARRKTIEIDAGPEQVARWLALRLGATVDVK